MSDLFWQKVLKTDGCWEWQAARNKDGYGIFSQDGKTFLAHRFSYCNSKGDIPEDVVIMHSCDNPPCCNPDHLSLGTQRDNMRDKVKKKRHVVNRGTDSNLSKLTEEIVIAIRRKHNRQNLTMKELAEEFDLNISTISRIINKKIWSHLC